MNRPSGHSICHMAITSANTPTLQWLFHLPHGSNICHINYILTVGGYITPKTSWQYHLPLKHPMRSNTSGNNICNNQKAITSALDILHAITKHNIDLVTKTKNLKSKHFLIHFFWCIKL